MSWSPIFDTTGGGWRQQAACRHVDANLFFPAGSTGAAVDQIEAAKAVCRACPVRQACLQFALEANQEDGIWGGTDEIERRRLRRSRRQDGRRLPNPMKLTVRQAGPR